MKAQTCNADLQLQYTIKNSTVLAPKINKLLCFYWKLQICCWELLMPLYQPIVIAMGLSEAQHSKTDDGIELDFYNACFCNSITDSLSKVNSY